MPFNFPAFAILVVTFLLVGCGSSSTTASQTPQLATSTSTSADTSPAASKLFASVLTPQIQPNTCATLDVELQDSTGVEATLSATLSASLASTSTTGAFYSDSSCTLPMTSLTIAPNTTDQRLYYKDAAIIVATLTFTETTANGLTAATAVETTEAVTQLAFVGGPLSQALSQCGALTLESQDPTSHAVVLAAPVTLQLTTSSSGGGFYSDSACSSATTVIAITSGVSDSPAVYYKDSVTGTAQLSASESPSQSWTKAAVAVTITGN